VTSRAAVRALSHFSTSECFRHAAEPVAGRGPWQAERARAIGQKLGIEKALRGAGELEGKVRRRKCYDLVGGFVVVEIIVIILHEENRSRPEIGAVNFNQLRFDGSFQHGLVVAPEHQRRAVEFSGDAFRRGRRAHFWAVLGGKQIPIDLIADRHHGRRRKRQGAAQQSVAHSGRQETKGLMAARAGIEQHAKGLRLFVRRRKGGEAPRLAQGAAAIAHEGKGVRAAGFEVRGMELPKRAAGVARSPADRRAADAQHRRLRQRGMEGRLHQNAAVAHRRQEMPHAPSIPLRRRWQGWRRSSIGRHQQAERRGGCRNR